MPIYEFHCETCEFKSEELRKMGDTAPKNCDECGKRMEHVISVPRMLVWNKDRSFPNVTPHGDGSMKFQTKEDYEVHLKENHQVEVAHDGLKRHKPGAKVTTYASR